MRKCVNCGASLDDDAVFCVVCGTKAQPAGLQCPHCGAPIDDDSVFCTSCGGKVSQSEATPVEVPVEQSNQYRNQENQRVEQPSNYMPVVEEPSKGNNNNMVWYIIGGIIGGLLLVAASYFGYQKFSKHGQDVEAVVDDENYDTGCGDMTYELYGSVANYLITMNLYFEGDVVDGSYYYDRKGPNESINLSGTFKENKLDLYETDASGRQTGHFDGYFDGAEYKGIFINRDGKRMSFILNDNPPTSKPDTSTSAPSSDPDAQYVKVTGVNVRLRTTPSINDNNIIKDARGKNVHPYKGERLKMVSEEDEFYLVIYRGDYVYISKQFAVLE